MLVTLTPHPETPAPPVTIAVEVLRPRIPGLSLRFRVSGDISRIRVPERVRPSRADELWRTTCFEAFVAKQGGGYCELNLSPEGRWEAYEFTAYRDGMYAHPGVEMRDPERTMDDRSLVCAATFDLDRVLGCEALPWRMGLSAVVEDLDGRISYWALAHAPGKPDFHHPDSFALELPAPEAS
jgi:hypothetical protein